MNFRSLLLRLDGIGWDGYTSDVVAHHLGRSVREVSNDLRRLHHMGFLRRKRTKRLCLSGNGKLCHKGYEYIYSLSEQGRSYLVWMKNGRHIEDLAQIKLAEEIMGHLPHELKNRLLAVIAARRLLKYRGPSRHFRLVDDGALSVADIRLEKQKLSEANRSLNIENATLASSIAFYKGFTDGLTETIKQDRQREDELTKSVLDFLPKMSRYANLHGEIIDIMQTIILNQRDSRDLMLFLLFRFLPEEKAGQAYQLIADLEKKGWADVERKREALKVTLHEKFGHTDES